MIAVWALMIGVVLGGVIMTSDGPIRAMAYAVLGVYAAFLCLTREED